MNRLLIVDGNFYLHRCWSTLKTSRPIEDVLPQNFLGLVLKDACAIKATHLLIAFDGPSIFRYEIYPDYKIERRTKALQRDDEADGSKEIYTYLPATRALLDRCGIVWVQKKKYEADDVMASVMVQMSSPELEIVGGTGDKDIFQALMKNCKVYNSATKIPLVITPEKAMKKKGVPISGMVMYQTLLGDKIDSVPQILPPVKAKQAVMKWGTFKAWFAKGTKEDKLWLNANQAKLMTNRKLVELVTGLSLPEIHELKVPKKQLEDMPRTWYAFQDLTYPKSKGLFKR
jgi:DNA polymerase-1